jgi:ParB family chromosome partitioning protein
MEKKALGKGLEALLPDRLKAQPPAREAHEIPIDRISPNPYQPRTHFDPNELSELTESIKRNGLLQPVLVRRKAEGVYELIAGERRLRAAKAAGLVTIPAIIRNSSDEQAMELALVENLQRKDLNPMEAARAYYRLTHEFGFTQETIAHRVGKDRSSIANMARLLNLPNEIQLLIESGALSTGHAKVLLGITDAAQQRRLAELITAGQLSVRQTERLAASTVPQARPARQTATAKRSDVEERLQKRFGTRVTIVRGRRGGKLMLHFFSAEEFERLMEMLLS